MQCVIQRTQCPHKLGTMRFKRCFRNATHTNQLGSQKQSSGDFRYTYNCMRIPQMITILNNHSTHSRFSTNLPQTASQSLDATVQTARDLLEITCWSLFNTHQCRRTQDFAAFNLPFFHLGLTFDLTSFLVAAYVVVLG